MARCAEEILKYEIEGLVLMKRIRNSLFRIFVHPVKDNGLLLGGVITLRNLINLIYNIFFLWRKHIKADFSSDIRGINYIEVGSAILGRNCRIEIIIRYNGQQFSPKLKIGNHVILNDMVHIGCANYIEIGDYCIFASRIYISDHNHGRYKGELQSVISEPVAKRKLDAENQVIIGKNVWLGEGVAVLPGSIIGENSIIGANAVVNGYIPPNCIAVGIPAKVIKKFDLNSGEWIDCRLKIC